MTLYLSGGPSFQISTCAWEYKHSKPDEIIFLGIVNKLEVDGRNLHNCYQRLGYVTCQS